MSDMYYDTGSRTFLGLLFLILLLIGLVWGAYYVMTEYRIIEVLSGHAWEMHGEEVNRAVDCLNEKGSMRSFKTKGFTDKQGRPIFTNLWLCFDGDNYYALVTTKFLRIGSNTVARLVTAYRVATDLFPTIDDFISYITLKWSAIEIDYVIEAGNIILIPR